MNRFLVGWRPRWIGGVLWLSALTHGSAAGDREFGFTGPEVFPIDRNISLMQAADLDGDGTIDLVVVNNDRSRINLLMNQTGQTNRPPSPLISGRSDLNELPPDARFRIESIASEKRVTALAVADFNSDGLPDLAHYGEPRELTLQFNSRTNAWRETKKWKIPDGQTGPNALTWGDVNGDQLSDVLLLGDPAIFCLYQTTNHAFGEPEKLAFSDVVKAIQILDIDGDGRQDLLLVNWESPNPLRFRLQDSRGQLGPEIHFNLNPVRAFWADDLNHDRQTEMISIAQNSGRAQLSRFVRRPAEPLTADLKMGPFEVIPLNKTAKNRRGMTWTDLNRDGRTDLAVAEPDSGQVSIFLQDKNGRLESARTFPCLTGISEMTAADWNGDGTNELFVLSADERQVGWTYLSEHGRLPFPQTIPAEGRPLAMTVGALNTGAPPALIAILDQDGQRVLWIQTAKQEAITKKLSSEFKSNPVDLLLHDVDQDGAPDLVVVIPYEKIKILRQGTRQDFEEIDLAPPGGTIDQPWVTPCDVDGDSRPELLLAQKNFLRALVLQSASGPAQKDTKGSWAFLVKEQINGASSQARITAATGVRSGTNRVATLALLDAEQKALTLCHRDAAGVWQVIRNLPLPVTDFGRLEAVSLGDRRIPCVAMLGLNAVATMAFDGQGWELAELGSYETPIKDGFLMDVVSGDLDQDGLRDLVFLESAKHHVDLVRFSPPRELTGAVRWQVFEERTFRGRSGDIAEPREALVADLTADGKSDLAVLVHDRILLYPQE
jgi:hypothetical protein